MSCKIHNVRFYNLEPKSVICFSFEPNTKKLALARLVWDCFINFLFANYNSSVLYIFEIFY